MNKLRSILTHEDVEVRCSAIETLSKLTIDVAINVAGDGLFVFPFESHEARICCQQDMETMVNDCWKLIFHTLSFDGQSQSAPWAAGAAFTALTSLFARSSTMAPFFPSNQESTRVQAPIDDVASMIYKQAFPRIRALIATAPRARCPSVSVPYMEIDTEDTTPTVQNDDEPHASTEPFELMNCMCRAVFILLAHPLQTFTRMRWAAQLANYLIAQCYLANRSNSGVPSSELKIELCVMLVKTFDWLSGVNCLSLFVRTTEALYLLDHEKDRRDLVQTYMDTIGFSRLSPRTNGSEVFRALFQALSSTTELPSSPRRESVELQISQLIALRVFRGLLLLKLGGSATTSPKAYLRSCEISENIVYYTGLLTAHFQSILASPELALRESLDFFQQELFPTMDQIASQSARLQILWIGNFSVDGRLFTAIWNDDDEMKEPLSTTGYLAVRVPRKYLEVETRR
ncbi:hypothetical protein GQ600_14752 [Phytophthora cactorum]|nr:hypothetical protein GQ600_14752 [Phytophthora cactorum]